MRRDTRAGRHGTERGVDAAGDYARKRTAGWLLGALEQRVEMSSGFFQCLGWATGGLNGFVARLEEKTRGMKGARDMVDALRGLHALQSGQSGMAYACEEFFASQARMREIARECAAEACRACMARPADDGMYVTAGRRLSQVFGLEEESCLVCEFIFMIQQFPEVESYFEDELKAFRIGSRRLLSGMLGISASAVRRAVDELLEFGMVDVVFASSLRLTESVLAFWEPEAPALDELFFRLLEGETLPLRDFFIPEEQIRHVLRLLRKPGGESVHVLLYGASGTGKTSFVRSLARECGVKAWAVTSRDKDGDADRRASLTACLHMASRQEGSFVVVDEAERLLDTGMVFGRNTKDKAWLNALLERPGRRVIWISNEVGHIDPAVRRRFSFSIHFERLGVRERVEVWRQVLKRAGLARRFSAPVMRDLSVRYPVEAAVIQKAVSQAAGLYRTGRAFHAALDRILQAHIELQADGESRAAAKAEPCGEFFPDGVCMDGDVEAFMARCRRMDEAMRSRAHLRPGFGTMLFYGPSGTGKTVLAGQVAATLGRPCLSLRASDLLGPFAGLTEKNIAGAFREAEETGAVLVVDEVDSFLFCREGARQSWENGMVNEFLTALERCRTFCIGTTNRREELDEAAMRRFSCKVAFRYAREEQVVRLYESMLTPLCGDPLPLPLARRLMSLTRLTPGDFVVVRTRYDPLFAAPGSVTHEALVAALEQESALKTGGGRKRMGFMG